MGRQRRKDLRRRRARGGIARLLAAALVVTATQLVVAVTAAGPAQAAPLPLPTYDPAAVANPTATVSAGSVPMGGTSGGFSVDDTGAARYEIPLRVVPGRGGFQPKLSLSYRSDGGPGHAGAGFSLSGLSQISRCDRTVADDGIADGVGLDATDRFCLNGLKLVAVSGTYGGDGTEYRTKPDTHVRVKSFHAGLLTGMQGPVSFTVWTGDGEVQEYGTGNAGVVVPAAGAKVYVTWPITKARDGFGNTITYAYQKRTVSATDNTEIERWPTTIRYGSATKQDRVVTLGWETRPDKRFGFAYGFRRETTQRLRSVTMSLDSGGFQRAREYTLEYETAPTTGGSRLRSVKECGTAPTECRRPTTFEWWDGESGFADGVPQTGLGGAKLIPSSPDSTVIAADYNGDGRTDLAWPEVGRWKYLHAEPGSPARYTTPRDGETTGLLGTGHLAYPIDYDLDGRDDLLPRELGNIFYRPVLSRANFAYKRVGNTPFYGGFNRVPLGDWGGGALVGDFDGDGYQDVLQFSKAGAGTTRRWEWRRRTGTVSQPEIDAAEPTDDEAFGPAQELSQLGSLHPKRVMVVDVNGDGRDEIVYKPSTGAGGFVLDVTGDVPSYAYNSFVTVLEPDEDEDGVKEEIDAKLVDLNGDGLTDMVTNGYPGREDELWYWLNDGRDMDPVKANVGLAADALALSEVVDYNGDGRHELLVPRQGGTGQYVGLDVVSASFGSTGTPTFTRTATAVNFPASTIDELAKQGTRVVDADGDGQQDVLVVHKGYQSLVLYVHKGGSAGTKPDLLRRVREGTANPVAGAQLPPTAEVTYSSLSDNDVYFLGSCPRMQHVSCVDRSMHVVRRVERDAGLADSVGTRLVSDYFYQAGRVSKKTRSFLGFAERRVSTKSTAGAHQPVVTRTFYSNTAAGKDPRPVEEWTYATLPGGQQFLQRTDLHYGDKATVPGTSFNYVSFSQQRSYQIPGYCCLASLSPADFDGLGHEPYRHVLDVTEEMDAYGNAGVRTRVAEGNGSSYTKVTTTPGVDTVNWLLRRPSRVVTEEGVSDPPPSTVTVRTSDFSYAGLTDRVSEEKAYATPTARGQELTTTYSYDAEGNVERTTATDVKTGEVRESTAVRDPLGYPHATMNAVGHVSRTGYDPVTGTLKVAVDANGLRVDTTYDSLGRPVKVRQPSGAESTTSYTLEPRPSEQLLRTESTDGTGALTQTVVDRFGRPVVQRFKGLDGKLRSKDLAYEAEGGLRSESTYRLTGLPATDLTTWTYDDLGRPLTRTQPGNAKTSWTYTKLDVTEIPSGAGKSTRSTLDALGRAVAVVDGLGSPDQVRRTYGYGPFGTLLRTAVDGVAGSTTTFVYDERNNLTSSTDPVRGTTTSTYDAFGSVRTTTDALGRQATMSYDPLGRLVDRTVRQGGTVRSVLHNDWDTDEAKTRIRKGMLMETTRTDNTGAGRTSIAYDYDGLSRLSGTVHTLPSERDATQTERLATDFSYDAFGRTTLVRYPALEGRSVRTEVGYGYAPNGALANTKVAAPAAEARTLWTAKETDGADRLTLEESGDGVATTRAFDWRGGVTDQVLRTSAADAAGETTLLTFKHFYDGEGKLYLTRRDVPSGDWAIEGFEYDSLDRVTRATVTEVDPCADNSCRAPAGAGGRVAGWTGSAAAPPPPPPPPTITRESDTWAYDKLGNIISSKRRGTHTYDPAKPYQAKSVTGGIFGNRSYGYDAVGNQTVRPDGTVTYNDLDLPAKIVSSKGQPDATFGYWPGGARARKVSAAGTVTTVPEVYERHRTGTRVEHRLLVRAGGRLVATLGYTAEGAGAPVSQPPKYVHADRLGSATVVTADTDAGAGVRAAVLEERGYDAFGLPRDPDVRKMDAGYTSGIATPTVDQGYTGHEEDRELGLVDMGGRVYDPTLARFLTPDPVVNGSHATQAWNAYSYVSNNPLRHTDPSGNVMCFGCPEDLFGSGGAPAGLQGLEQFAMDSEAFWEGGEWAINPINADSAQAKWLELKANQHSARIEQMFKDREKAAKKAAEAAKKAAEYAAKVAKEKAEREEALKKLKMWLEKLSRENQLSGQNPIAGPMLAQQDVCTDNCSTKVATDAGSCPENTSCVGPLVSEEVPPGDSSADMTGAGGAGGAGGAPGDVGAGGNRGGGPAPGAATGSSLNPGTYAFAGLSLHGGVGIQVGGVNVPVIGWAVDAVGISGRDRSGAPYVGAEVVVEGSLTPIYTFGVGGKWTTDRGGKFVMVPSTSFGPVGFGRVLDTHGGSSDFWRVKAGHLVVGGGWRD
jgi:RHS repeat-associated protein